MQTSEPVFNIKERTPLLLAAVLLAIHIAVTYGPSQIERSAEYWALLKSLNVPGQTGLMMVTSLLGHGFLHGSWTHVLLNCGMLVAFGVVTMTAAKLHATARGRRVSGNAAFFAIFFAGVIVGGLGQWLQWFVINDTGFALGASGGVSALFASAAYAMGGRKKLVQFGMGWLLINLIMIFAGGLLTDGAGFAWAAHLAGYVAGAVVAPFLLRPNSTGFSVTP